ncbi:MAG: FG-GAP repeat protein [Ignavibacteriales bacterium]|nr:FG-GAP repeat protein [Ignavibacteriales bacterium]MCB9219234.1 FG-GAP repeat protein [Ignavibacteriales bacterium]
MKSFRFYFYIISLSLLYSHFSHGNSDSINQDWYSKAIQNIEKQEYNITFNENLNAYQSPNRKNNLRFTYKNNGFTVQPRATEILQHDENNELTNEKIKVCDDWNAEFTLLGYGRNKKLENSFKGKEIIVFENQAYIKDENMRIDYVNNEKGMRQNFTIYNKPQGNRSLLNLQFNINTKERIIVGADALIIKGKNAKEYMKYNSLKIWDADGKVLRGWFDSKKNEINEETKTLQIVVNDKNAKYPITIDPLSSTADLLLVGTQAESSFGYRVSTAGDINGDGYSEVLVGAPYFDNGQVDEGKVFMYLGSAFGPSAVADWTTESNQDSAYLGFSLSTAGDVNADGYSDIIIGAYKLDKTIGKDQGGVFVYYGNFNGLPSTPSWEKRGAYENVGLGISVSTAGDVNGDGYSDILVTAQDTIGSYGNFTGKVFAYYGSPTGLSTTSDWTINDDESFIFTNFGLSISTAGDLNGDGYSDIIIGATKYLNFETVINNFPVEGKVFAYYGSLSGLSASADWSVGATQLIEGFGISVSTAGDVNGDGYSDVIVGAYEYDNGETNEGRAFVYHGSANGLSQTANWTAESNQASAYFGVSVSTAGDVNGDGYSDVIVGANFYENGETNEGRAFVYHGSASGLSQTANWSAESNNTGSGYGGCVTTAGDVNGDGYSDIIIGASYYNNGQNNFGAGAVFIYFGFSDGLSEYSNWAKVINQDEAYFGCSVSTAGDVNGDGFSDVIIGAYGYDHGQTDEGAAFVFYGSNDGLASVADWSVEGNQSNAYFGKSVSTAGDINGDGYGDVIIGASNYTLLQINSGAAFVYYGSSSGLLTIAEWYANGTYSSDEFGKNVSIAGDVNGDGYSDIIIADRNEVFVYHGSSAGLATSANRIITGEPGSKFGFSISTAGDVNGDGYSDVIIGATGYSNIQNNAGAAFVYYGSALGLSTDYNWHQEGNYFNSEYGYSVSTAGDVNGDGFSDVIVSESRKPGIVYVYHGSSNGLSLTPNWIKEGDPIPGNFHFGYSVATAGDVNGDGYSDIIIGDPNSSFSIFYGSVYVFHGSPVGLQNIADWLVRGGQANSFFGANVSAAGDINGDGYGDVIVGYLYFDNPNINGGGVSVFYGNKSAGSDSRLRQNKTISGTPIFPGCLTESDGEIEIGLRTKSPFGRTDGRIIYEIKKNGEPFSSGTTLTNSVFRANTTNFVDLGVNPNGKAILTTVSGLPTGYSDAFKWRARKEFSLVNNPYQKYGPWKFFGTYAAKFPYAFKPRIFLPFNSLEIQVLVKVFLEGPYSTPIGGADVYMSKDLNPYLPHTSPFEADVYSTIVIPARAVDWILVELRDKNDSGRVLASRAGFLLDNKKIVEWDGASPLYFNLPEDDYYIAVKHRNHLPVMSASPVHLTAN